MYDELELDLVGDRKTALFFIISDTDATFNFLVSIIPSFLTCFVKGRMINTEAGCRCMCAV